MGMFYKVSDKQLLKDRNELFNEVGVTSLKQNAFELAPFKTSWAGEYNRSIQGYSYQFGRIREKKFLEIIHVYIIRGDSRILIYLNAFELSPAIESISELKNNEGLSFGVPPNHTTRMQLRCDDYKGPPILYTLFKPEHKLGSYFSKAGYQNKLKHFKNLIKSDMENINEFVTRWFELYKPFLTDWEGNITNKFP